MSSEPNGDDYMFSANVREWGHAILVGALLAWILFCAAADAWVSR